MGEVPARREIEPRNVSPVIIATKAGDVGRRPECGCTLAKRQPNSLVTRSIARVSRDVHVWQPP